MKKSILLLWARARDKGFKLWVKTQTMGADLCIKGIGFVDNI